MHLCRTVYQVYLSLLKHFFSVTSFLEYSRTDHFLCLTFSRGGKGKGKASYTRRFILLFIVSLALSLQASNIVFQETIYSFFNHFNSSSIFFCGGGSDNCQIMHTQPCKKNNEKSMIRIKYSNKLCIKGHQKLRLTYSLVL